MGFFSITAKAPLVRQAAGDTYHERLDVEAEQFVNDARYGFRTGSFTLKGSPDFLADWYKNGLGRDIAWRGPDGFLCYRGYVSRVAYERGGFARTRELDKFANQVIYVYTRIDANGDSEGQYTVTVNDTVSQKQFGVKTLVVSGGEKTQNNATTAALSKLAEVNSPTVGETQLTQNSKDPVVKVRMAGHFFMFDWYAVTFSASVFTTSSQLITDVMGQDPNGVFTDTSQIDTNSSEASKNYTNKIASKVVDETAKVGRELVAGVTGEPWVVQVWEGNRVTFKAAEGIDSNGDPLTSNKKNFITRRVNDTGNTYVDATGQEIPWWHIRPDSLVFTEGIPGPPIYVQQTSFIPPASLTLSGRGQRSSLFKLLT